MMSDTLAKDFRAWLSTQPIIAQMCDGRVCEASMADTDTMPYIVFQQSGFTQDTDLDGSSSLATFTLDLEVRADKPGEADEVANEVRRLINGFPQDTLEGDKRKWNGRSVCFASINDHSKDYEVLPVGSFETDSIHAFIVEVYADG